MDEGGFEALRPKKQPGQLQRLTETQKEEIKIAILSDPSDYGYNVRDEPSLSDLFLITHCRADLGLSPIRNVRRRAHKESPGFTAGDQGYKVYRSFW